MRRHGSPCGVRRGLLLTLWFKVSNVKGTCREDGAYIHGQLCHLTVVSSASRPFKLQHVRKGRLVGVRENRQTLHALGAHILLYGYSRIQIANENVVFPSPKADSVTNSAACYCINESYVGNVMNRATDLRSFSKCERKLEIRSLGPNQG